MLANVCESDIRVRLRDSLIGRLQGSNPAASAQPKNLNGAGARSFARNLEDLNAPEETNDKSLQLSRIVEGIIGVENETGAAEKAPLSAPLIAPTAGVNPTKTFFAT